MLAVGLYSHLQAKKSVTADLRRVCPLLWCYLAMQMPMQITASVHILRNSSARLLECLKYREKALVGAVQSNNAS